MKINVCYELFLCYIWRNTLETSLKFPNSRSKIIAVNQPQFFHRIHKQPSLKLKKGTNCINWNVEACRWSLAPSEKRLNDCPSDFQHCSFIVLSEYYFWFPLWNLYGTTTNMLFFRSWSSFVLFSVLSFPALLSSGFIVLYIFLQCRKYQCTGA